VRRLGLDNVSSSKDGLMKMMNLLDPGIAF